MSREKSTIIFIIPLMIPCGESIQIYSNHKQKLIPIILTNGVKKKTKDEFKIMWIL